MTLRWPIAGALLASAVATGCGAQRPHSSPLLAEGRRVFVSAGCGRCHAVASVHTHGGVGPNFDTSERLDRAQIRTQLDLGVAGMPSYRGRLTAHQEDAVTEFVFQTLHRRG